MFNKTNYSTNCDSVRPKRFKSAKCKTSCGDYHTNNTNGCGFRTWTHSTSRTSNEYGHQKYGGNVIYHPDHHFRKTRYNAAKAELDGDDIQFPASGGGRERGQKFECSEHGNYS